jgi:hypothetical protein
LTLTENGGVGGTGVYIREGTTSRVTAADRPYGKFYDFEASRPNYHCKFPLKQIWNSKDPSVSMEQVATQLNERTHMYM